MTVPWHEEARALRAADPRRWTILALAVHFEVSQSHMGRVLSPYQAEHHREYNRHRHRLLYGKDPNYTEKIRASWRRQAVLRRKPQPDE